ncbi:MAG: MFS transporter [Anaerolineae bacterium]|nr:MFS transporter [Thermoflexales bacterium]MDW8407617.1 MFS transporter [Anaerolineae bacterium]
MSQHQERWINRNVIGLAINRFLSDFGHEASTAILPVFLTAIGAPAVALGAIEAVADGLSSFAKLIGGWLGDRIHQRRPLAALGYTLTGVTTGLYGLASAWPAVLVARAIGWAGRGLRSPLHDALLTDSVPAHVRGRAFGLDEAADTLGAIAGPLAALGIIAALSGVVSNVETYRIAFWLAAIPGVLAALSIVLLVTETPNRPLNRRSLIGSFRALPAPFRRYLVGIFVFGSGDFSHTLLILFAVQQLTPAYPQDAGAIAIQLYTVHNVLYAAGSYPVGVLADRFGKRGLLIGAYCLAIVMNALLIGAPASVPWLAAIFVIGGMVYSAQQSLERAIAADLVQAELRSTGFGALATVNGIGDFVSSLVVGALWTAFSPAAAFAYSLVLSLAGAAAIATALRSARS